MNDTSVNYDTPLNYEFAEPDIHKVSRLLSGKKGQLKKEITSVVMMTNFGFGPMYVQISTARWYIIMECMERH